MVALARRRVLVGDDRLVDEVIAVRHVDVLGPLRGERDLVDVDVEVLGAGRVRVVELDRDPPDRIAVEAELLRKRIGEGALEAGAGRRVTQLPRIGDGRIDDLEVRRVGRVVGADRERARGDGRHLGRRADVGLRGRGHRNRGLRDGRLARDGRRLRRMPGRPWSSRPRRGSRSSRAPTGAWSCAWSMLLQVTRNARSVQVKRPEAARTYRSGAGRRIGAASVGFDRGGGEEGPRRRGRDIRLGNDGSGRRMVVGQCSGGDTPSSPIRPVRCSSRTNSNLLTWARLHWTSFSGIPHR